MNAYSIAEMIKTGYSLLVTKLTMPEARLIRRPVYIRGRQSILGCEGLTMGRFCRFDLEGNRKTLFIGKNCEFGDMTHIVAHESVEIGNNVLIASKCFISDTNHGNYKDGIQSRPNEPPRKRKLYTKSVKIGNNVWIGENVVILAGSVLGDGCVVGANSVVSGIYPKNVIIAGTLAKQLKHYDEKKESWMSVNRRYKS